MAAINRRFPSVAATNWVGVFDADPELLGHVLRDILREQRAGPTRGKTGPRPGLDRFRDGPALDRLRGLDPTRHPYSLLPFVETFALLVGERSVRAVAAKLRWPPARVQRLRSGQATPTMQDLEHIAGRYGHHPAYFVEYRTGAILEAMIKQLGADPQTSIGVYERLWSRAHRAAQRAEPLVDALRHTIVEGDEEDEAEQA